MGEVFRAEDVVKGQKRLLKVVKDLSPDLRNLVWRIFESWEGPKSERKLIQLLGEKKAKLLLKKVMERDL